LETVRDRDVGLLT